MTLCVMTSLNFTPLNEPNIISYGPTNGMLIRQFLISPEYAFLLNKETTEADIAQCQASITTEIVCQYWLGESVG